MTIIIAILALGVLIFVHELGHFLLAKWNGVGVVEFAIGFGKPIWQKQVGETNYSIRLIPLGGYVRMVGDDLRLLDDEELRAEFKEQHGELGEERWFLAKGYWAKFAIVVAGPAFNVIFALLLAMGSFYIFGKPVLTHEPVLGGVVPGYPAAQAGLQTGDRIDSVGGVRVTSWGELARSIASSQGDEVELSVMRPTPDGSFESLVLKVQGTDQIAELELLEGRSEERRFKIGIFPETERVAIGFTESISMGAYQVWSITELTFRGLWGMISGLISPKNIAGPIYIFQAGAEAAQTGLDRLFDFMIFLSVSLAILNLLPIPILDGGHLLIFTIEALKGGRLNIKIVEKANMVGLALLLLLMVYAVSNDVMRLFS